MITSKKNFWFAAVFGLLIGGAFTVSALTEPTSSPSSITSYPPINLGADTQIHQGNLGFGDGTNVADSTKTGSNSLWIEQNLLSDAMVVRQNANFDSNVTVDGRNIVAGTVRVGQVALNTKTNFAQGYTANDYRLFLSPGLTTNLVRGNWCTTAANTACPSGSVISGYNASTSKAVCRYIAPAKSPVSIGSC